MREVVVAADDDDDDDDGSGGAAAATPAAAAARHRGELVFATLANVEESASVWAAAKVAAKVIDDHESALRAFVSEEAEPIEFPSFNDRDAVAASLHDLRTRLLASPLLSDGFTSAVPMGQGGGGDDDNL